MPKLVYRGSTDLKAVSHVSCEVKICFLTNKTGRQRSIAHFTLFTTNLDIYLFFLSFQPLKLAAY